jgi:hypothetical protein
LIPAKNFAHLESVLFFLLKYLHIILNEIGCGHLQLAFELTAFIDTNWWTGFSSAIEAEVYAWFKFCEA